MMFENLIQPIRTSLLALAFSASMVAAQDLPAPTGEVILTITGTIEKTNAEGALVLDAALLASLPQHSFTTSTIWTRLGPRARP
jgi:hypothetical protein